MRRLRLLDAFCGEGGAGAGYQRAGFEVTGVDNAKTRLKGYPFEAHLGDAVELILEHGHEYDVIHASPPCTGYSRGTAALPDRLTRYDRGLSATDDDGTPLVMDRHRLFESNLLLMVPPHPKHDTSLQVAGSYGGARRDKDEARRIRKGGYVPKSVDVQRALLGTPWMTEKGCQLSIPPVFTEFLGAQVLDQLAVAA
jgi:DNA (cytosine-5)-methyltransferase 1